MKRADKFIDHEGLSRLGSRARNCLISYGIYDVTAARAYLMDNGREFLRHKGCGLGTFNEILAWAKVSPEKVIVGDSIRQALKLLNSHGYYLHRRGNVRSITEPVMTPNAPFKERRVSEMARMH